MPKKNSSPFSVEWPSPSSVLPIISLPPPGQNTQPSSEQPLTALKNANGKSSATRSKDVEARAVKLAQKIVKFLAREDVQDSIRALQIAKILLPTPAAQRK